MAARNRVPAPSPPLPPSAPRRPPRRPLTTGLERGRTYPPRLLRARPSHGGGRRSPNCGTSRALLDSLGAGKGGTVYPR